MDYIELLIIEIPEDDTNLKNNKGFVSRNKLIEKFPKDWKVTTNLIVPQYNKVIHKTEKKIVFQTSDWSGMLFKDMKGKKDYVCNEPELFYSYKDKFIDPVFNFQIDIKRDINSDELIAILQYIRENIFKAISDLFKVDNSFDSHTEIYTVRNLIITDE